MAQQTQEQDINHLLKVRREKLAELQQNGRDPFQITKFDQTHHSLEVKGLYEAHETELLKDRQDKVDVLDLEYDEEIEFQIVGSTEANSLEGKISNESPVGKALIGAHKDDIVDVETPAGIMQYKVLSIQRNI